jgi:hypothetical protein
MTRTNKLGANKLPLESVDQVVETALDDVIKATAKSFEDWRHIRCT